MQLPLAIHRSIEKKNEKIYSKKALFIEYISLTTVDQAFNSRNSF